MRIKPILHFSFPHNEITKLNNYQSTLQKEIMAQVVDITDKAIFEAIVRYANEKGITDLFILDEEFVKTAIENEIKRRKGEE